MIKFVAQKATKSQKRANILMLNEVLLVVRGSAKAAGSRKIATKTIWDTVNHYQAATKTTIVRTWRLLTEGRPPR